MKLKEAGKGDTDSHDEIPEESLDIIFGKLAILQKIMRIKDKTLPEYRKLVSMLPEDYQDSYHILINYGTMFIIAFQFALRGVEGIAWLKKSHFVKTYEEAGKYHYLKKVFRGLIKQHR